MENFYSLGLPEALLNRLDAIQYQAPTPIQAQTIPHAIKGFDILGTAQTGTGKTAAYVIPLVYHLLNEQNKAALILTPTREIAIQVTNFLNKLLDRKSGIRTALIIGGDSMLAQMNQLRNKPNIIVGTPGRVNDHLDRGSLKLDKVAFMVLDETDRMLDMGFSIQLDEIFKYLPAKRQTLMFSATLPQNILKIANQYLNDPVRISIGSTIAAADTITQEVIHTSEDDKYGVLLEQLEIREGSVIVFVKTKFLTEKLAKRLRENGHMVDAIHGDLRQRNREKVMRYFRSKKNRILVATDIAARGLDIAHVECVINHDLPQCEEDFIHRIGRTGRAGMEGVAVSLITPQDHIKWRNINKMMNPNSKIDLPNDERRSPRKRGNNDRFKRRTNNESLIRVRTFDDKRNRRQETNRFKSDESKFSRDNSKSTRNSQFELEAKPKNAFKTLNKDRFGKDNNSKKNSNRNENNNSFRDVFEEKRNYRSASEGSKRNTPFVSEGRRAFSSSNISNERNKSNSSSFVSGDERKRFSSEESRKRFDSSVSNGEGRKVRDRGSSKGFSSNDKWSNRASKNSNNRPNKSSKKPRLVS